jgi:hypothetical protein
MSQVTTTQYIDTNAPTLVQPEGKTRTARALSIVSQSGSSYAFAAYCASKKGKIGEAGRIEIGKGAPELMARAILSGNYKPAASALALELDDTVELGSPDEAPKGETPEQLRQRIRQDWECMPHLIRKAMRKIPEFNKAGKTSPKWAKHQAALTLHTDIQGAITAILEARAAAKAAAEAPAEGTSGTN